jgi:hypothetical protein
VRPDGYVAFTGSDKSSARLAKFCDTWLIPETLSRKMDNALRST